MKKNLPITGREMDYPDSANILSTTDLKGIITYINRDFTDISGFDEDELLKKSHNVVRHPEMPPAAFADLWETIKAKKSWMGLVKNRCKSGDHYWVDAFVSPILRQGQTAEYQSVRTKPAREHVERAEQVYPSLLEGKTPRAVTSARLGLRGRSVAGVIGAAVAGTVFLLVTGTEPLSALAAGGIMAAVGTIATIINMAPFGVLVEKAKRINGNPLSRYLYTGRRDDIGDVLLAIKMLESESSSIAGRIADSADQLARTADSLNEASAESSRSVRQQQSETDQVATAVHEMSASIQEVSGNAHRTSETAMQANRAAVSGKETVVEAASAIQSLANEVERAAEVLQRLEKDSNSITSIVEVISDISEQTNLLALNAAIEAARAGEQGRGFAVVADEVRTLASRTQDSTGEVRQLIEQLQRGAREAVAVMEESRKQAEVNVGQASQAAEALDEITAAVQTINDMSAQIATAVEEQSAVSDEINRSISSIRDMAETSVMVTERTTQGSRSVTSRSSQLSELAAQFWGKRG